MKWTIIPLVLAAAALTGCAPDPQWHAAESFTAEERAAMIEAEAWIAEKTGQPARGIVFDLTITDPAECPGRCIFRGTSPGGVYFREQDAEASIIYVNPEGRIVDTQFGREAYWLKALVAHEVGHYYGLSHHEGQGVMNPEAITFNWTSKSEAACLRDVAIEPTNRYLRCAPAEQP